MPIKLILQYLARSILQTVRQSTILAAFSNNYEVQCGISQATKNTSHEYSNKNEFNRFKVTKYVTKIMTQKTAAYRSDISQNVMLRCSFTVKSQSLVHTTFDKWHRLGPNTLNKVRNINSP